MQDGPRRIDADVLAFEQVQELVVALIGPAFGGFICNRSRPVVRPKKIDGALQRRPEVEGIGRARSHAVAHDTGGGEALDHILLDAQHHRTNEALRRRRRVGGDGFQTLRQQRRGVQHPVSHHNAAAGTGDPYYCTGHVEWRAAAMAPKALMTMSKLRSAIAAQIRRIILLEAAIAALAAWHATARFRRGFGDIDAQHLGPQPRADTIRVML
jgi:hypothetical protein